MDAHSYNDIKDFYAWNKIRMYLSLASLKKKKFINKAN